MAYYQTSNNTVYTTPYAQQTSPYAASPYTPQNVNFVSYTGSNNQAAPYQQTVGSPNICNNQTCQSNAIVGKCKRCAKYYCDTHVSRGACGSSEIFCNECSAKNKKWLPYLILALVFIGCGYGAYYFFFFMFSSFNY
eukprot:TRINITY_DN8421_c0_g1_i1.p1 TRINITY_DN8421_c0_g1~~TRINITY_DN8421_c0_g1_i1.p1  ORF type:complete len:155 (-),score=9.77 TRINITY_DN8421_c0_g1_i1:66-476(-)